MKMMKKVAAFLEKLKLTSLLIIEFMKGGNSMMITFLALTILDGLMKLEDIKNKKLRKLVKAEIEKMGLSEVVNGTEQ